MTSREYSDMDDEFVRVAGNEEGDFMEFPKENDGNLMLSTVQSQFENAIGLKYKASSGAWRGLRAVDNVFDPPRGGWGSTVYYVTESDSKKRKIDDSDENVKKSFKSVSSPLLQDMAVLGLPWTTTDSELKEYFEEKCGELAYAEVKHNRETGKSRGFGFIRFKTEQGAKEALCTDHFINGRKLEVRQKKDAPMKLFIGRLPEGTTKDDLWEYFSKFGELKDTYIPSPFRGFGFITYASSDVGNHVLQECHVLKGVRLNVDKGEESKSFNMKRGGGGDGGRETHHTDNQNNKPVQNYTNQPTADPNAELKTMLFSFLANQK